jgi:hypothetical protein
VSFDDGIRAVEMGMQAQLNISNTSDSEGNHNTTILPITAYSTQSCEQLLNLAIDMAQMQAKLSSSDLGNIIEETKGR